MAGDPSTYIPTRELRERLSARSPVVLPFFLFGLISTVWVKSRSERTRFALWPNDRFLTDSVWFGVEWQTWEARSHAASSWLALVSLLFTSSISKAWLCSGNPSHINYFYIYDITIPIKIWIYKEVTFISKTRNALKVYIY